MNFNNLLNQLTGSNPQPNSRYNQKQRASRSSMLGGAAAGGILGLLAGNKTARKFAGKGAMVGGTALIGGIAFKAFKNWQRTNGLKPANPVNNDTYANSSIHQALASERFQLTLVKAMIAAAKSDGHIDAKEQQTILDAVRQMNLNDKIKSLILDLLNQPIDIEQLIAETHSLEQKTEVYLASCLAIDIDTDSEQMYLNNLARALRLPADLEHQIRIQAEYALDDREVSAA